MLGERAFEVKWDRLTLLANCSERAVEVDEQPAGRSLWGSLAGKTLDPWSAGWWLA